MSGIRRTIAVSAAVLALAATSAVAAQTAFKWVDSSGQVHYGDRPPSSGAVEFSVAQAASTARTPGLPVELANASRQFPVVLYVTDDCNPCSFGRRLLAERGIPYTEKRVNSAEDIAAMKALGFAEIGFPALSVGREQNTGFDNRAWARLLDGAGYPAASMLPAGWQAPPATPLAPATMRAGELAAVEDPSQLLQAPSLTRSTARAVAMPGTGFRF